MFQSWNLHCTDVIESCQSSMWRHNEHLSEFDDDWHQSFTLPMMTSPDPTVVAKSKILRSDAWPLTIRECSADVQVIDKCFGRCPGTFDACQPISDVRTIDWQMHFCSVTSQWQCTCQSTHVMPNSLTNWWHHSRWLTDKDGFLPPFFLTKMDLKSTFTAATYQL